MGFFSGLNAEQYDRQYGDRQLIGRIVGYLKPQWKRLLGIGIAVLGVSLLGSVTPVAVSRGVDVLQNASDASSVYLLAGLVLLIGVLRWTANWLRRRETVRLVATMLITIAGDAFKAAADHDLSFYDRFSSGKVVSRITTDTRDFGQLVTLATDVVSQISEALILGIVLINIEWRLTLYVLAIIPVVYIFASTYRMLARKVTRDGMRATADVNSSIKETVSGIAIAKNFRQEAGIFEEFSGANSMSYKVNLRRGFVLAMVFPILNGLGGLAVAMMVYFGGMSAAQGIVTAGAWYLFLLSLDAFLYPVMSLSSFLTQIQTGLSAAERVFALIDAEPAVHQTGNSGIPPLRGEIEFRNLNFSYQEGEPVLVDFNLKIRAGENLAIVGHTGAGKSSIARLVSRFYEFQSGELLVDGMDIRSFDLNAFRRQLGIVSQVPFLFAGSVLENIRYACPDISESEVLHLARQIGDGEWMDTLSNGLETQVGERGSQLSMGQRQLVSLMRVLVQKPAIFILDEATASIDPFTEWQIQQALGMILKQSTSILIAHRLSTIRSADRILVIQDGRILEEGNHEGLLDKHGHYAELYNTYFRHQSLNYRPSGLDEYLADKRT